mmetsp:Transcript_19945/g.63633  ORF Transcript_19945/g.63633 Transcript_19945/m.63633 type:complete len:142 (+) Transcript_19945:883-1308(+)
MLVDGVALARLDHKEDHGVGAAVRAVRGGERVCDGVDRVVGWESIAEGELGRAPAQQRGRDAVGTRVVARAPVRKGSAFGRPLRSHMAARRAGQRVARCWCRSETAQERAANEEAIVFNSTCSSWGGAGAAPSAGSGSWSM